MRPLSALLLAATAAALAPAADNPPGIPAGYTVQYKQTFEKPDCVKDFVATVPGEWKHGAGFLELAYDRKAKPAYATKHRSPFHFALVADKAFTDFVMDVELQSTTPTYGHQDMCLFFGFESPEKYYYVHIAKAADPNAHNVFIVNDAPRKNIATETTKGIDWKDNTWHKVRLVREAAGGKIEVYFDDLAKPIMRATDKTFAKGYLGFGSFDDTGRARNLTVYAPGAEAKRVGFLTPLGK